MQIKFNTKTSFQRKLRPHEEADFSAVLKQGKEKVGNTGHSMLIIPSASLPQEINTGMGNFLDKSAQEFVDFAKLYWGINNIQILPEFNYKQAANGRFLPYSGSTLDLGTHNISMKLLTTKEYGKLLTDDDINKIVEKNNLSKVNFENVLKKDSINESMLKKAFDELLKSDTEEKKKILNNIEIFTDKNKDWLEPKSIYEALGAKYNNFNYYTWNEFDRNFYNTDIISLEKRLAAIEEIKNSPLKKEMDFFNFKQYLAEEHLKLAKEELNKKGIKLSGDMPIGFSREEIWANPKAFIKNCSVGWGLQALDYDSIEAQNLLKNKVRKFAERYDGLRIDAAWIYVDQPLKNYISGEETKKIYNSKILDLIDKEIKNVKGENFNFENVTYEFTANQKDFNIFEGSNLKTLAKDRIKNIVSFNASETWATTDAFKKLGWENGSYILGCSNHDFCSLRNEYNNFEKFSNQQKVLSKILKIPKEKLSTLQEFIQAKFAEPLRSKHNMFFFTEALNILEHYKDNLDSVDDYRIKVKNDYQENYFKSLQKGEGFNIMDALEKAFVAENLDKKEPELYKKIVKYKKILQESETIGKTEKLKSIFMGIGLGITLGLSLLLIENKKRADKTGSNAQ